MTKGRRWLTGDWNNASFDDLAGDVAAAFLYLKTRRDIDAADIGLMGISQAGWIMPLAANREAGIAFLISISGAGVSPAETTVDQARNEMTARGMPSQAVTQVVELMKLQNTVCTDRQRMGRVCRRPEGYRRAHGNAAAEFSRNAGRCLLEVNPPNLFL